LDIDNNAEVVAAMTVSDICEAVANDKSKLAEKVNQIVQVKKKNFRSSSNQRPDARIYKFFVVVCNIEQQTSKGVMSMSSSFRNY
jgi:hypothetical protein